MSADMDAAVEAGAEGMRDAGIALHPSYASWAELDTRSQDIYRADTLAAITAALPILRKSIGAEIEAEMRRIERSEGITSDIAEAYIESARIAREATS